MPRDVCSSCPLLLRTGTHSIHSDAGHSPSAGPVSRAAWDIAALGARERCGPAHRKELCAIEVTEALEERGDKASPPGLMAGARTNTVVPILLATPSGANDPPALGK